MEYELIHGYEDNVNKRVKKRLEDGWQLYGSPSCSDHYVCQAVTKIADVEKDYGET